MYFTQDLPKKTGKDNNYASYPRHRTRHESVTDVAQYAFKHSLWWTIPVPPFGKRTNILRKSLEMVDASPELLRVLNLTELKMIELLEADHLERLVAWLDQALENCDQLERTTFHLHLTPPDQPEISLQCYSSTVSEDKETWLFINCFRVKPEPKPVVKTVAAKVSESEKPSKNVLSPKLLGSLSHDLRAPLIGIQHAINNLENLEENRDQVGSNRLISTIDSVRASVEQSLVLVNDIVTVSQQTGRTLRMHPSHFMLDEMLDKLNRIFSPMSTHHHLEFEYDVAIKHSQVYGDRLRLSQVLQNLLFNAFKFTQTGYVRLKVSEIDNFMYRFEVSDTGIGIREKNLDKIFNAYEQDENKLHSEHTSSGLGLFIVKTLLTKMGANINVKSERHVGSRFWFDINLVDRSNTSLSVKMEEVYGKDLPYIEFKRRALMVDDQEINRLDGRNTLEKLGFEVMEADSVASATTALKKHQFDWLILDYQLLDGSGLDIARLTKQLYIVGKQLSIRGVMIVSANHVSELDELEENTGMVTGWLMKPLNATDFIRIIAERDAVFFNGISYFEAIPNEVRRVPVQFDKIPEHFIPQLSKISDSILEDWHMVEQNWLDKDIATMRETLHRVKGTLMVLGLIDLVKEVRLLELSPKGMEDVTGQSIEQCLQNATYKINYIVGYLRRLRKDC